MAEEKDVPLAKAFTDAFAPEGEGGEGNKAPSPSDPNNGGEGAGANLPPDPLESLDLDALLQHPKLGPTLNSWADKAAANQVRSALAREREQGKAEGRQEVETESRDRYFTDLAKDKDALARELAADDELAAEYASWQQSKQSASGDAEAVARTAQVFALATEIRTWNEVLAEAKLPAELLADSKLKPESYVDQGPAGVVAWGKAITNAIADQRAKAGQSALTDEAKEALRQELQAEIDAKRPGGLGTPGRTAAPKPDLIKTRTSTLFADAFGR